MAYATPDDVRFFANLDSSDISDEKLNELITFATAQVNRDITVEERRERLIYIDSVRQNDIDGTNSRYYIKNFNWYFADRNDNGEVATDDIVVYQVDGDTDPATETKLTVTSIDEDDGHFDISTTPDDVDLYVTYKWAKVSSDSQLIKLAVCYLAAAQANSGLTVGGSPQSFTVGEIRVVNNQMSTKHYMGLYLDVIGQINNQMVEMVENESVPF